jgi:hypothetical protein
VRLPAAACGGVAALPASPLAESLGSAAALSHQGFLSCRFAAAARWRGCQRHLLIEDPQGQIGRPLERQAPPGDAVRGREGYLRAQFLRLKQRRGPMEAIVAVAASILTAAYYMLRDGNDYHDLGAAHFQRGDHARLVAGLTRRLHHLGYEVTLRPAA